MTTATTTTKLVETEVTATVSVPVYDTLTRDELMEKLDERDLAYRKKATKAELIDLLQVADAAELAEAVEDVDLTHRSIPAVVGSAVITPFVGLAHFAQTVGRGIGNRVDTARTIRAGRRKVVAAQREFLYQTGRAERKLEHAQNK